jgi:hypothetical protein
MLRTLYFAGKNFQTGLTVRMTSYNVDGTIHDQKFATELATTGVYGAQFDFIPHRYYIVIAEEIAGGWKAFQTVYL